MGGGGSGEPESSEGVGLPRSVRTDGVPVSTAVIAPVSATEAAPESAGERPSRALRSTEPHATRESSAPGANQRRLRMQRL
jgi:hypothetical protein